MGRQNEVESPPICDYYNMLPNSVDTLPMKNGYWSQSGSEYIIYLSVLPVGPFRISNMNTKNDVYRLVVEYFIYCPLLLT